MSKIPSRRAFLSQIGPLGLLPALLWSTASAKAAAAAVAKKTVLFFGDSLTAGYGLEDPGTEAYPGLIGSKLKEQYPEWRVVNAGLSGETTSAGLRRIDWVLRQPVDLFFLALGGNDGLRGIPSVVTQANLQAIIVKVRSKNPKAVILLAGMKMPLSMGSYATDFGAVYPSIATADKAITLLPFLLEGVGGIAALNLGDAIHPNPQGHRKIAEHVWPVLEPLVKAAGS